MPANNVKPLHPTIIELAEKVLARCERTPTGCLRWTGAHNPKGYGQIANGTGKQSKVLAVHRVVFVAAHGPMQHGDEVDHLCRVRDCVEITHLEAVTHAENVRRAARNRASDAR